MIKNTLLLACGCLIGALSIQYKSILFNEIPAPVAVLPDGGEYDGEMRQGLFYGRGRLSWPNETFYLGDFKGGLFHGHGRYETPYMVYEGRFENGQATGFGEITYHNGNIYKGHVENWIMQGKGVFESDAYRFDGHYKSDEFNGPGKITYNDGSYYQGDFKNNVYHGRGSYTTAEGEKYVGEFVSGELSGAGDYYSEQAHYHGSFKNGLFDGQGTYIDTSTRQTLKGMFTQGVLNGSGEMSGADGSHYRGEFIYGQFHGKGEYKAANGDLYVGEFVYNQFQGKGTMKYAQPLDGIETVVGIWRDGILIESADENVTIQDPREVIEKSLYRQTNILNQHLNNVTANDPEKTELYFVGVAGDGSQGVFRREVEFVKRYFDETFFTAGKSLLLVNSDKNFDNYPLVTNTSIELALKSVAKKMDSKNDILFLYLTSHGSKKFDFSLNQRAVSLNDLPAKRLGQLLKSLPVKWKVVVVSACYSGGFIDEIKDKRTLVITAAASDKPSFGCEDRANMTYFGEAFFKDALPQTESFVDAFKKARESIVKREMREGYSPSNPQIYKPASVAKQLAIWRSGLAAYADEGQ